MKAGEKAPLFKLFSDKTEPFDLSDYQGSKPVLLLFFPGAFTGVCTTELNMVSKDLEAYSGANIVGISTDSPFSLSAFSQVTGFEFDLLSDHNADVSAAYDSKYDHDFTPMKLDRISRRSAFVIDTDGIIQYAEILENAGEMPDLEAIKATLSNL